MLELSGCVLTGRFSNIGKVFIFSSQKPFGQMLKLEESLDQKMASLDPYQTFVDFLMTLFSFRAMAGMDSKVLMGEDLHTPAITSRYRTIGDTNDVEATMMTLLS